MLVRAALPKGSLEKATFALLAQAGFNLTVGPRSYAPAVDDEELQVRLVRAQEIPRYVVQGVFDIGITGHDWVVETGADVEEVLELVYSKASMNACKWVLAVPEDSPIRSVEDLRGKRIATELVGVTRRYLAARRIEAEVEFSWGATEAKAPDLVDAIVDITETGRSLAANKLRIIDVILETTTRLIAGKESLKDPGKRRKIENFAMLLEGALVAQGMVGLKMNVNAADLSKVLAVLPALKDPTVNRLREKDWYAVETVLKERQVRDLVPELKRAGARDIIEYALNKVIL
ncbi:MAG TPA: ATP phosphoribosyltransferase [Planctomycetota bacterium]|jgi:ATP phosphoribosyltransferase|nr:ATP phosphoribosyltransferase [Planctomycetota bacterium]OQC22238.1 MAG: ATP phosphoribosyltransferase [Planctomycetes bacterium ADurb.Bin069]NMD36734.1 ATP phosphoribosyltransferase [Planctomycetota bacterium]HNS00597.1 ATP phosphoribosyltransferase [Planctomycetota bacterium]HNU25927.1 ATP phosphoribosyltransferase [Planctomycetota bacterium]